MPNYKTPHNFVDLSGRVFGAWRVVAIADKPHGKVRWLCVCDCGAERAVVGQTLISGKSTSCGCSRGATYTLGGQSSNIHDANHAPGYASWVGMRQRCNNPNTTHYARYGGRGISVCEKWDRSFAEFMADMGPPPTGKNTIERKNNDGNYEPDNCYWASRKEQAQNRHANTRWQHRVRNANGTFA